MGADHLVKVVVTTYNRRSWAQQAIQSVLTQTHPVVHVVAVDDASDDGTTELLREFEREHPGRFTVVAKASNRGLSDSVRLGIEAGPEAPYVAILNDDDLWLPHKLERQLELFKDRPDLGLVFCEAELIDQGGAPTGQLFSDLYGRFTTLDADDAMRGNRACASTPLIRTDIARLAARTWPEPTLVSDYYLVLTAAAVASIAGVDTPLARYRLSASSMIATRQAQTWRDTTLARERALAAIPELTVRLGGDRTARRKLARATASAATVQVRTGELGQFAWQAARLPSGRDARALMQLGAGVARELIRRFTAARPD